MDKTKIISCDIDGILTLYPQCWLDYLEFRCGIKYQSLEEAKRKEKNYKEIKDAYRRSSFKANLPINPQGLELLLKIRENGYTIIMASSRPMDDPNYPELRQLTYQWLTNNNVPFNELVYKNGSVDFVDNYSHISFHIEDEHNYAEEMAKKNITTFLYNKHLKHEIIIPDKKIIVVPSLLTIINYI